MIDLTLLYSDYDKAVPQDNSFLMSHYYNYCIPEQGSYEYYQFLALLKLLEYRGEFRREMLMQFV